MKKLELAIVGCGAVSEAHLMAVAKSDRVRVSVLVDKSRSRAEALAERYGVETVVEDYHEIVDKVEAAVLALPHFLHAPVAVDLLQNGLHVLVEKPMATSVADCDAMISAAAAAGKTLTIGQLRRFFHSSKFVKKMLERGMLGKILSFDAREGTVYNWPAASDFTFRREAGGGTLADAGAHTLDLLLWWLGDYESLEYYDDAMGGVEADCEIRLKLKGGAAGVVELSRTRDLRNTIIITGENGSVEVQSQFNSEVRLQIAGQESVLVGKPLPAGARRETPTDLFEYQLAGFVDSVRNGAEPLVSGAEARRAVALIEAAHKCRQPLAFPWSMSTIPTETMSEK